jgi:large subunit ribosomal protein L3
MKALIGKKIGMTRIFSEDGNAHPVTLIQTGANVVVQVKSEEVDGYNAVQLGYGVRNSKRLSKPLTGHFKRAGVNPVQKLSEVRIDSIEDVKQGQEVKADIFRVGEKVDVVGISKGLGFQGTVRRHGFGGGPKTHGQSDRWRAPGSIGQSSYPSRVFKGLRMAGKMGNERVTVRNLRVILVDAEKGVIGLRGAVPGKKNSLVKIRKK